MAEYGTFLLLYAFLVLIVVLVARRSATQLQEVEGGIALDSIGRLSPRTLYLNVVLSQGLVLVLIVGLLWWNAIPFWAIGITESLWPWVRQGIVGVAFGIVLYLGNEASVMLLDRYSISYSNALRRGLAPESTGGWILLFVLVLPLIAVSEELLFRAAAIGVVSAGFAISPWILVVLSSLVFAIGHGAQGAGGIIVTGALGLLLGSAFVITNSLLLVVVAHYVVNGLEIGIHEGLLARKLHPSGI